ncbi:GNAT family N-acetyltransferase [Sphingosinicella sp. LHD-64]|uniref:GNAT family N-acetyltransferase n=1 Tax=Sphingosinicella sp. LHD-64 TaxID=3072139 RepID=UPI00280D8D2E|nr:GNAT family N-acetyltransferase [Sphingosinicella sp. LHD-64]MDQ8757956.1 GNAT family N-acetyltransferase [Sphingosinicella sp. LHD-64]
MTGFALRPAIEADLPALRALMARAIAELQRGFLTPQEIAASHSVMGLDTQLVADGTYWLAEAAGGELAGCGGWSRRRTLYGGDHSTKLRDAGLLDPAVDAARIRAMYTDPDFTRRGVGRLILEVCEREAAAAGFRRFELMATLAGVPLYRACGYVPVEEVRAEPVDGVCVPLVRMRKDA